jgi:putative transposase
VNAVRCDLLQAGQEIPMTKLCTWLQVARSTAYHQPKVERLHRPVDEVLSRLVYAIIQDHPTFGVRRVWAWLRYRLDQPANRKKVHRLMRIKGWTVRQRAVGKRPRVPGSKSIAPLPNIRWSTDIALVDCGIDGWCAFVPVLDCCTREVLGWSLGRTARTRTVEQALEEALIHRFGWTHGAPLGLLLRHDNGLVFGSRAYRALVRDYGLKQEYITPYTPEQNGLCERFIRSFKEECAWLHRFQNIQEARTVITRYLEHYNTQRPHQALAYRTPREAFLNSQPAA